MIIKQGHCLYSAGNRLTVALCGRGLAIARAGRVPDNVWFGSLEDWLARALVIGRTTALLALDRQEAGAYVG